MSTMFTGDDLGTLSEIDMRVIDYVRQCPPRGTNEGRLHYGALQEFGWRIYLDSTYITNGELDEVYEGARLAAFGPRSAPYLNDEEIVAYLPRLVDVVHSALEPIYAQWAADDEATNAPHLAALHLRMDRERMGQDDPYDLLPTYAGMKRSH